MAHRREEANIEEPRAFAVQPRDAHVSRRRAVAGLHGDTAGVGGQGGDQSAEARWAGSKGDQYGLPKAEESKVGFEGTLKNKKQRGWGEGGRGRGGGGCQRQPRRHAPPRPPPPLASNRRVGCRAGGGGSGRPRRAADAEPTLPRPPTPTPPEQRPPVYREKKQKAADRGHKGVEVVGGAARGGGGGGKKLEQPVAKKGKQGREGTEEPSGRTPPRDVGDSGHSAGKRGWNSSGAASRRGQQREAAKRPAGGGAGARRAEGAGTAAAGDVWRGRGRCTPGLHPRPCVGPQRARGVHG